MPLCVLCIPFGGRKMCKKKIVKKVARTTMMIINWKLRFCVLYFCFLVSADKRSYLLTITLHRYHDKWLQLHTSHHIWHFDRYTTQTLHTHATEPWPRSRKTQKKKKKKNSETERKKLWVNQMMFRNLELINSFSIIFGNGL